MDIGKIKLIFNTIYYLKPIQVYYRVYYFIRNSLFGIKVYKNNIPNFNPIIWSNEFNYQNSYFKKDNSFIFLNIAHSFAKKIDWNYNNYGKLWTYNLNYFDFLNQENISIETGLSLIMDYLNNDNLLIDGKEPYPISLRGINWIKFLSKNKISDKYIDKKLYNSYYLLLKNIEYHLLGNHLLENAFSLLFGAFYFQDEKLYSKSKKILISELNEQILGDGCHFELSPMYHQIILLRVLDSIKLIKLNNFKNDDLLDLLKYYANKMLSWLQEVTFNNGDIPMVNDSANGIAPKTNQLIEYANKLKVHVEKIKLNHSGYRMIRKNKYEIFIDVGNLKASYQPGHTHSDIFNFILYVNKNPFIVDTGTSTYEKNKIRMIERGTKSHNTVSIGDHEQIQIWGGFRVANRARITHLEESENFISSTHDGFKKVGVFHNRKFQLKNDSILIYDKLNKYSNEDQIAHFHFHPSINDLFIKKQKVYFKNHNVEISFNGEILSIKKDYYKYANEFNNTVTALKLKVLFKFKLETRIIL